MTLDRIAEVSIERFGVNLLEQYVPISMRYSEPGKTVHWDFRKGTDPAFRGGLFLSVYSKNGGYKALFGNQAQCDQLVSLLTEHGIESTIQAPYTHSTLWIVFFTI